MADTTGPTTRKGIGKERTEYKKVLGFWQRCRDVLEGEDAVKAKGTIYLPKLGGQTIEEYAAYKDRALFYNGTARTRLALVGSVFRKDADIQAPKAIEAHLQDITLDGTPLNDFAMEMLQEVIGVGRAGVLIDMPDDSVPREQRRPYWIGYKAEQIIKWRIARYGSDYVTSLLILKEEVEEADPDDPDGTICVTQYRRLELMDLNLPSQRCEVTTWRKAKNADGSEGDKYVLVDAPITLMRRGTALTFIPFTFINPTSLKPAIEKPPLLDMVDVNLSHYRTSADLEHGEHFTALPTPWVSGLPATTKSIQLGPTNALILNGQGASAGMLEFKGEGLGTLVKALERKQEMMAVLGARLIEQQAQANETATSVASRNAASHATLSQMANAVSLALTQVLRWHVWWFGLSAPDADVSIELNREFIAPQLTSDDVKAELLKWQGGGCSFDTFYYNMTRGGRTRPGVTAEEEKAAIDQEEQDRLAAMPAAPPALPAQPDDPAKPGTPPAGPGKGAPKGGRKP